MPITKARLKISDYNNRRKANLRKEERRIRMVSLSLTSMVDMFAILVIFLLVNSSTVSQWIEVGHGIELPKAHAVDQPQKAATVQISTDTVYGDTKALISNSSVMGGPILIDPLKNWLSKNVKKGGYVNLVAHNRVPYGVIRKVIATCQDSGFGNVNLAIQPKASN